MTRCCGKTSYPSGRSAIQPEGGETPTWTHSPSEGTRSMPRRGETMPPEQRQKIADALRRPHPTSKRCPRCGETKPASEYRRRAKAKHLMASYCLPCEREKRQRPRKPPVAAIDRFMAKVAKSNEPDGCWRWTAAKNGKGYGKFAIRHSVFVYAHRWAYGHFIGPVPDGLFLDHLCHGADLDCAGGPTCVHRSCVNPAHLEPVTNRENLRRGRRWPRPEIARTDPPTSMRAARDTRTRQETR